MRCPPVSVFVIEADWSIMNSKLTDSGHSHVKLWGLGVVGLVVAINVGRAVRRALVTSGTSASMATSASRHVAMTVVEGPIVTVRGRRFLPQTMVPTFTLHTRQQALHVYILYTHVNRTTPRFVCVGPTHLRCEGTLIV